MKLLLVTAYSPFAATFGAQQRTKLLYDALSCISNVDVLLLEGKEAYAAHAVSTDPLVVHASWRTKALDLMPYAPDAQLMRVLAKVVELSTYDVICGRYLRPLTKLVIPSRTATIVDLDDMGYAYSSQGLMIDGLRSRAKTYIRRALELRTLRRFSAFWFVSERDRRRHQSVVGTTLPNIPISVLDELPEQAETHRILFVGALWYGPNREGIERFIGNSWPAVRAAIPEATLRLVGGAPVDDRHRWSSIPGVEALGFVEDLAAEYRDAAICIAPIHSGGGTNIKILEALGYGRACVTTMFCRDAFEPHFSDPGSLAVATDDKSLSEACVRLLLNRDLRTAFAKTGHLIVRRDFNLDIFRQSVADGIAGLRGVGALSLPVSRLSKTSGIDA